MAIRIDLSQMVIGDKIICEYVASNGAVGTFSKLGTSVASAIPVASSATPNGSFYYIYVGDDFRGRKILIADRNIQHTISWNTLNTSSIASGLPLKIDNNNETSIKYTTRLLTGGVSFTDLDNEWDKYIVSSTLNGTITAGDNTLWNWSGVYSYASTTHTAGSGTRTIRGKTLASTISALTSNTSQADLGFRPVLIVEKLATNKYLIQDGTDIKYYTGSWAIIGTIPVTKAMFDSNGMTSLSAIDNTALQSLVSATPKLLSWTDDTTVGLTKTLNMIAFPYDRVVIPNQNLAINGILQSVNIIGTESNGGKVRVIVSPDNGVTWYLANPNWTTVSPTDLTTIKNSVSTIVNINLISTADWASLSPNSTFRFGYYLDVSATTDVAKIYSLQITKSVPTSTPSISALNVLYDAIDSNYYGLIFTDMSDNYYSTSLGDILKYLDFGTMIAGQSSAIYQVNLRNFLNFPVQNITLTPTISLPNISVALSATNQPFIPSSTLVFPSTTAVDGTVTFYIQVSTTPSTVSGGNFDVNVKADPV